MAAQTDVIDWHEAMQQCGDDEEFLREVLADLRTEVEAQLSIIAEIINVSEAFRQHYNGIAAIRTHIPSIFY